MPIDFICPHCNHQTLVADSFAGHWGPCSNCGQSIRIPGVAIPVQPPTAQGVPYPGQPGQGQYPAQGYSQQPYYEQGHQHSAMDRMLMPVGRSVLAIVAGYLGLISVCLLPAPIALITGILAIREIKKSDGKKHGMGRAIFGIVMGGLGTIILLVLIIGNIVAAF